LLRERPEGGIATEEEKRDALIRIEIRCGLEIFAAKAGTANKTGLLRNRWSLQ
jgi:hypothetical protein